MCSHWYLSVGAVLDWLRLCNRYIWRHLLPIRILLEWFYVRGVLFRHNVLPLRPDVEWIFLREFHERHLKYVLFFRPVLERDVVRYFNRDCPLRPARADLEFAGITLMDTL